MTFKTIQIIHDKLNRDKKFREQDKERKDILKEELVFAYKLKNDFNKIREILMSDDSVKYVEIQVDNKDLNTFIKTTISDVEYKDFIINAVGHGVYRVSLLYT